MKRIALPSTTTSKANGLSYPPRQGYLERFTGSPVRQEEL